MRRIALIACLLTVCITGSSAFLRHWQAGLGCDGARSCSVHATSAPRDAAPQPGPAGAERIAAAAPDAAGLDRATLGQPDEQPIGVLAARALHRVAASVVGILAVVLVFAGWSRLGSGERIAAALALLVTAGLAWLGLHTPSVIPLVTVANVSGGLALAAAFGWIAARESREFLQPRAPRAGARTVAASMRFAPWVVFALVVAQAAIGVLIAARGAIGQCAGAICSPSQPIDFAIFDPRVVATQFDAASAQALHLAHRIVALGFALVVLAWLRAMWVSGANIRPFAALVLVAIVAQASLGFATASGASALASATAHNMVAALIVASLAAAARRARA